MTVTVAASQHSPTGTPQARTALAIVGPTACGKSALALHLAQALAAHAGVDIISMDSALVYRGMDIGTAKPSAAERAQVPHHLIDIIDPTQAYSAAEFARDAMHWIAHCADSGRIPLIVGGTLLYLKALTEGLDDLPASDPAVRAAIAAQAADMGWPAMHARLFAVDPITAQRLSPNDGQRIGRALEVWTVTSTPLSTLQGQRRTPAPALNVHVLSLQPGARSWLHDRIAQRFDDMLQAGFLDEVQGLRQRGDLHADLPSMRCVGYRQAWQGLAAGWSSAQIREQGICATRQLAKRQLTWLRSWPPHTTMPCDVDPSVLQQAGLQWAMSCLTNAQARPHCNL